MDVYLVGGAVRDALLGRKVAERDWVVVGATAEDLLREGYRQVGRDFPVFLHPDTKEEYALARRERKTGPGHTGFDVQADPEVTLQEDLLRRDLTINAMAQDTDGRVIDPFNGRQDLADKCLRHVSDAFREDPLRVFRVARFAAQLDGFTVHPDTMAFMTTMADELSELAPERVWREFSRALAGSAPQRFVDVLQDAHCLLPWFPELQGVSLNAELASPLARFGAIGWTAPDINDLSERLKTPTEFARLAGHVRSFGRLFLDWRNADLGTLLGAIKSVNGWRNPEWRRQVFSVVGTVGGESLDPLDAALGQVDAEVDAASLAAEGLQGAALGARLDAERLKLLEKLRSA